MLRKVEVTPTLDHRPLDHRGINMVDLMMWLVIAALLLAAAIQGIGYYQKAAIVYQMSNDLENAASTVMAEASQTQDSRITESVLSDAIAATPLSSADTNLAPAPDPWNEDRSILAATHPTVTDHYVVYLPEPTGGYNAGVHVIPKDSYSNGSDPFTGPGPQPVAHPTVYPSGFSKDLVYMRAGTAGGYPKAFTLPGKRSDYTVEWTGTGLDSINVTIVPDPTYGWGNNGAPPLWIANLQTRTGGITPGIATFTANITENATGRKSSKTWTYNSIGEFTITAHPDYLANFEDKNVFVGSKDTRVVNYGVSNTAYTRGGDYTHTYAINNQTDTTGVSILQYAEPSNFNGNFGIRTSDSRGFQKGTITVTVNLTSRISGITHSHDFKLHIVDQTEVPFEVTAGQNNATKSLIAGSIVPELPIDIMLSPYPYGDLSTYKFELVPQGNPVNDINATLTKYHTGWYISANPHAGGYKSGSTDLLVKVTHIPTGVSNSKVFTITVP